MNDWGKALVRTLVVALLAVGLCLPALARDAGRADRTTYADKEAAREALLKIAGVYHTFGQRFGLQDLAADAYDLADSVDAMGTDEFEPLAMNIDAMMRFVDAVEKIEEIEYSPAVLDLVDPTYPSQADCPTGAAGLRFDVATVKATLNAYEVALATSLTSNNACTDLLLTIGGGAGAFGSCDPLDGARALAYEAFEILRICNAAIDSAEITTSLFRLQELADAVDSGFTFFGTAISDQTADILGGIGAHETSITGQINNVVSNIASADANNENRKDQVVSIIQLTDTNNENRKTQIVDVITFTDGQNEARKEAIVGAIVAHDANIAQLLANLTLEICAKIDTVLAAIGAHDANVTNQLNTILGTLITHDAEIKNKIDVHDFNIVTKLNTHDLEVKAAIAQHDIDIKDLLAQVLANQDMIKQHQLETACLDRTTLPSVYLPNGLGGQLEDVIALAQDTINTVNGTPDASNLTQSVAQQLVLSANGKKNAGQFKGSYNDACRALCYATALPDNADDCL